MVVRSLHPIQQHRGPGHSHDGYNSHSSSRWYRSSTLAANGEIAAAAAVLKETQAPDAPCPAAQQTNHQEQQKQQRLDDATIRQYVANSPLLLDLLGNPGCLEIEELLDGVINLVYVGESAQTLLVLKMRK